MGQYVAIPSTVCPCTEDDPSGCNNLIKCRMLDEWRYNTGKLDYLGQLCRAEEPLPDRNSNYDIDNCPSGNYVFRWVLGNCVSKIRYFASLV